MMVGTASGASEESGQLEVGAVPPGERLLEVEQPLPLGVGEVAPEPPFAQPEQQLLGRALVDAVRRGARVELGEERRRPRRALEEQLPQLAVERRVEVLRPEVGEDRAELGMREDAG